MHELNEYKCMLFLNWAKTNIDKQSQQKTRQNISN